MEYFYVRSNDFIRKVKKNNFWLNLKKKKILNKIK